MCRCACRDCQNNCVRCDSRAVFPHCLDGRFTNSCVGVFRSSGANHQVMFGRACLGDHSVWCLGHLPGRGDDLVRFGSAPPSLATACLRLPHGSPATSLATCAHVRASTRVRHQPDVNTSQRLRHHGQVGNAAYFAFCVFVCRLARLRLMHVRLCSFALVRAGTPEVRAFVGDG